MSYKVKTQEMQNYLRAEISGKRVAGQEVNDAISVWSSIAELCLEKDISKVLAIVDLEGQLSILSAYRIASSPHEFGWSRRFEVAVVDLNEESYKSNLFTETVAVNRGYKVKIFKEEESAARWLIEDQGGQIT